MVHIRPYVIVTDIKHFSHHGTKVQKWQVSSIYRQGITPCLMSTSAAYHFAAKNL